MIMLKRLMVLLLMMISWVCIAAYGAIHGWWLTPLASKGDTEAFWSAVTKMSETQSRGDIAMVLIRNGQVVQTQFKPSQNRVDQNTLFPLGSMSKWIAAYSVMQLVQAGKVDLDAPVSHYLKRWQLTASQFDLAGVTVRRLLSHTAGLTDALGFGDYQANESIPSLETSLKQPRASRGSAVIAVGHEPGSTWQYSGGGYLILQLLVEDVSGMSFADWTEQTVFKPIGMQRASYNYIGSLGNAAKSYNANGKPAPSYQYAAAAATGLSASANDLIKFAQAQVNPAQISALNEKNVRAMRQAYGRQYGADIWGLGVMLYAPTASGDYVYGHDGSNAPAINASMRINTDNSDAIIVLVSGNPKLASNIAYEWTLWQTGSPDFLMVDKVVGSALKPLIVGLFGIVGMFVFWMTWQRRRLRPKIKL